jgi:hypothetical protein
VLGFAKIIKKAAWKNGSFPINNVSDPKTNVKALQLVTEKPKAS